MLAYGILRKYSMYVKSCNEKKLKFDVQVTVHRDKFLF